jgi:alpha-L-fucosidase
MQLQLTELLTKYGPVALVWFDGLHHQEKYDDHRFLELIQALQPATLVNDRIGVTGDYQTPEQFIPLRSRRRACVLRQPMPASSKN